MECPGKVTPNSVVSPVKDRYQVGESVTVRCLTGYVLPDVSIESKIKLAGKKHSGFVNVTRDPVRPCE